MAEIDIRKVVAGYGKTRVLEDPSTLPSVVCLAEILEDQEKYAEAEALAIQIVAAYERSRGPEHLETAESQLILAETFGLQGKLNDTEQMCRKALASLPKVSGPDRTDTWRSWGILAMIIQDICRHDEALSLTTMMVDSCEQVHGKDSPKTSCWREFAEKTAERIKERGTD